MTLPSQAYYEAPLPIADLHAPDLDRPNRVPDQN